MSTNWPPWLCGIAAAAAFFGVASDCARGDVMYGLASVATPPSDAAAPATPPPTPASTRTLQIAESYNGTDIRTDTYSTLDGGPRSYDSVTDTAHSQLIRFDPLLNEYTRVPLDQTKPGLFGLVTEILAGRDALKVRPSAGRSGAESLTYAIQTLDPEVINGFDTKHYSIDLRRVTTGCLGDTTHDIRLDLWATDDDGFMCPPIATTVANVTGPHGAPLTITRNVQGDTATLQTIFSMQPIQAKVVVDGADKYSLTLIQFEHSVQPIDPAQFAIPTGWQQLSAAAFDVQERRFAAHRLALASAQKGQAPPTVHHHHGGGGTAPTTPSDSNDDSDIPTAPPPKTHIVMPGLPGGVNITQ